MVVDMKKLALVAAVVGSVMVGAKADPAECERYFNKPLKCGREDGCIWTLYADYDAEHCFAEDSLTKMPTMQPTPAPTNICGRFFDKEIKCGRESECVWEKDGDDDEAHCHDVIRTIEETPTQEPTAAPTSICELYNQNGKKTRCKKHSDCIWEKRSDVKGCYDRVR